VHINFSKTRHFFIFFTVIFLFTALFLRLLYIQIIRNKDFSRLANKQHRLFVKLKPKRGTVYDCLNRVLAISLDTTSIYAVPKEIQDKTGTARLLADRLGLDEENLITALLKDNYFMWVKRRADDGFIEKVKSLNLPAVRMIAEPKRFYPNGKMACHVLGITGIDNEGLEGVELFYDRELKGEYGFRRSLRDAKQREIIFSGQDSLPARDGNSLILTIDEVIQHIIENEAERIVKDYDPQAVSIVVLSTKTGEILGMTNYPWFDSNNFSGIDMNILRNRVITDSYEPGSVFKIVTASAALEEGVVDFDSEFFCENGKYKIGNRTLHDYRPYGTLKFREIIEKSSNIGTVKVADKLGKEKLSFYIEKFNFNDPTGVDLPGEASGIMRDPKKWSYVDMTTVPMGQGIAVTTLQLVSAVSAIANNGLLMKPYIVKAILNPEGTIVREGKPRVIRRVITEETASKVKELLKGVVENGSGRRAKSDNFTAGGKTGTAQKINAKGGYHKDKYIASFIGFAPYDNPEIALAISVDDPRKEHLGGRVAAPAFKNITERILSYMETESPKDEIKKAL